MVESRSPKPLVVGSSPTAPAKTHSGSSGCVFYFPGNSGAVWLISARLTCSRSVDLRSPVERQLLDSVSHFSGCWGQVLGFGCAACPDALLFARGRIRQPYSAQCGSFGSKSNAVCLCASRQREPVLWCRICCIFGDGLGTGPHPVKSGKPLHQKHLTFIRGHDIVNAYKYNKRSL